MLLCNRIVHVEPTLADGSPAPGYHLNVDLRILRDEGTGEHAQALLDAVVPYVVEPATPQFTFGDDGQTMCLRFPDGDVALAIGLGFGLSDEHGTNPTPQA